MGRAEYRLFERDERSNLAPSERNFFATATRSLNGITRTSRRNSGVQFDTRRQQRRNTCGPNRCSIGTEVDIWRYIQRENIPIAPQN
jgi:hypothetical protein